MIKQDTCTEIDTVIITNDKDNSINQIKTTDNKKLNIEDDMKSYINITNNITSEQNVLFPLWDLIFIDISESIVKDMKTLDLTEDVNTYNNILKCVICRACTDTNTYIY